MFARRSDLPFDKDDHSRFLPWLIAFMVFLAVLALSGMLVLEATAMKWDKGVTGTLSIQIKPGKDEREDKYRQGEVLRFLETIPEIDHFAPLSGDKMLLLLEPWLGTGLSAEDLPLPLLIDVELKPDADLDVNVFRKRLAARIPGVEVDDHRVWLERFVNLIRSVEAVATAVLIFIGLATVGTVIFTTRTGLAIHRGAIEVLHLIGARDSYIAGQFAARAGNLGIRGGLIGLCLSLPTLYVIGNMAKKMEENMLPELSLEPQNWMVIAALPLLVSLIARFTAHITVIRMLRKMS